MNSACNPRRPCIVEPKHLDSVTRSPPAHTSERHLVHLRKPYALGYISFGMTFQPKPNGELLPQDSCSEDSPRVGTILECTVRHVERFGVYATSIGQTETPGFVKRQDWTWDRRTDLLSTVVRGSRFKAQVLADSQSGTLLLSRRNVLEDPLPTFRRNNAAGSTVVGNVDLITSNATGVLLRLSDGVEGFVPRSEMPDSAIELDGFGLHIGDRIAAKILRYRRVREKMESPVILSVKEYLLDDAARSSAQRSTDEATLRYHPTLGIQLERLYWHYQLEEYEGPRVSDRVRREVKRILVVEDCEEVSTSLATVFRFFGLNCDVAGTVGDARSALQSNEYNVLILDLNLSAEKGTVLLDELDEQPSLISILFLTGASILQWEELFAERIAKRVSILPKPTSVAAIFERLHEQLSQDSTAETTFSLPPAHPDEELVFKPQKHAPVDHRRRIDEIIRQLQKTHDMKYAFLLSREPGPIYTLMSGSFVEIDFAVQQKLAVSPIEAVIQDRRTEVVRDARSRRAYFKYLQEICSFRSFAATGLSYGDQRSFGLFLLGEKPKPFSVADRSWLRAQGETIGNLLAAGRLEEVLQENQGQLLTGVLAESLLHEIKNELQTLDNETTLQLVLCKKEKEGQGPDSFPLEERMEFMRATAQIQRVSRRLNQLVVLFGNLAGRSSAERINLNQTLRLLKDTLRPYAQKCSAEILVQVAADFPEIRVNPRLVEQPLLNLMINGLEQMKIHACPSRLLRISAEQTGCEDYPIALVVADTGPGIHHVEWGRIFDLFVTTKDKGTGLGLYLSRFFVGQFGGRLVLRESLMFSGSIFAIEIPRGVLA